MPSSGDASASLGQPDSRGNLVFQPPSAPTSQAEASVSGPGQGTVGVGAVSAVLAAVEAAWALAVGNPGTRTATVDTQNGELRDTRFTLCSTLTRFARSLNRLWVVRYVFEEKTSTLHSEIFVAFYLWSEKLKWLIPHLSANCKRRAH